MRYFIGVLAIVVMAGPAVAAGRIMARANARGSVVVQELTVNPCAGMVGADRADCQLDVAEGSQR